MAFTTIDNPELYFQTKLYTGTGDDDLAITLDGDENMQPDMVWIKERNDTGHTLVYDAVRGATKEVYTNLTNAESTNAATLKSFDSDGFTLGTGGGVNTDDNTHVAWCWKESATAGFDIVSYTGNGSARTISHSLSAVPNWMIVFNRDSAMARSVYHHKIASDPATDRIMLNENSAKEDDSGIWNDTEPTSSVFSLGNSSSTNTNTNDYIIYLFSEKQGYSKFGSYEGNGNADGTFVNTGFSPAFVIVKPIDDADNWVLLDNKRHNAINSSVAPYFLYPNRNYAETTDTKLVDFVSNGFKIRDSGNTANRTSTFIYIAFAESPLVNSNGIPNNAK